VKFVGGFSLSVGFSLVCRGFAGFGSGTTLGPGSHAFSILSRFTTSVFTETSEPDASDLKSITSVFEIFAFFEARDDTLETVLLLTETHEDSLFCRFLLDCFDFATFLILDLSFTVFCGFKIFSLCSIWRPDLVVVKSGVVERLLFLDLLVVLELLVFLESVFEFE